MWCACVRAYMRMSVGGGEAVVCMCVGDVITSSAEATLPLELR